MTDVEKRYTVKCKTEKIRKMTDVKKTKIREKTETGKK